MATDKDLPDELQGRPRLALSPEDRAARLDALGVTIGVKRDAAVKARQQSGIEDVWLACEEAYAGIDDSNRAEFSKARWSKPTSMQGPLTANNAQVTGNKSTAFVRLTTRYVDMASAKLAEIILPIDDKAFSFGPTPVPDLVAKENDRTPVRMPDGSLMWRDVRDDEMAVMIQGNPAAAFMQAQGGMRPQVPMTVGDAVAQKMEKANKAAKKAEQRVYDWMVESRYPMQMRKVIHDAARIGVGVLKGPFPDERTSKAFTVSEGVGTLEIVKSISPACKWIDPWNFFPAANCGEDIHSGDGCFERDYLSAAGLKALKNLSTPPDALHPLGQPIYISAAIDKVIAEGPEKCNNSGFCGPWKSDTEKNRFQIWYYTGTLTRDDMEVMGAPGMEDLPDDLCECHAIITMVNDTVIGAAFNPLEKSGKFPYRTFPWSRRAGSWAGVGVGEQVSMPQKMVNAGTRALLNNAGKSSGSQIVLDQHKVVPADGSWDLNVGDKLWHLAGEAVTDDINKVFKTYTIPNLGEQLMGVIQYAFKLAEEASNIPLISQGQTGPQDVQTFGQAELQNNNANTLLRQLAYSVDDHITEPLVDDFYEWLLLDPDVPADEKGDFKINARGSIAMVEKAIQEQTLMQMLPLSLNPVWGQDPKKLFGEFMKAKRMNPEATAYTEHEMAKLQNQPPPKSDTVAAAEVNAASRERIAAMNNETQQVRIKTDTDRDTAYVQAEQQRTQSQHEAKMAELALRERIALAEFANANKISLDEAKVRLTESAMKLRTQIRLATATGSAPQVATPAIEPPGRAPDGQAFQK